LLFFNISTSTLCNACLLTANHSLTFQPPASITVSSPEKSYVEFTRIPSPIHQYVITLLVSLPIKRGLGVFMNVSVRENRTLNN